MRIILYTGKGGVGKTSISAITAVRAAQLGHRVVAVLAEHALVEPVGTGGADAGLRGRLPNRLQELVEEEPAQRLRGAGVAREERALDHLRKIDQGEDRPVEVGEVGREGGPLLDGERFHGRHLSMRFASTRFAAIGARAAVLARWLVVAC